MGVALSKNKLGLTTFLLCVLLASTLLPSIHTTKAQESNFITIRANGEIYPETAPIQKEGSTYILTSDITNCHLIVKKNNTIINGANHQIQSNNDLDKIPAIELKKIHNITVKNLNIKGYNNQYNTNIAILIEETRDALIKDCKLIDIAHGIRIYNSQNIKVAQNTIKELAKTGVSIYRNDNVSVTNNFISGNEDLKDTFDFIQIYGIHMNDHMNDSQNIEISNNTISHAWYGIEILTQGALISRNYFTKNNIGIYICNGGENLVTENTVIDSESFGIRLSIGSETPANIIYHNNFINNNMNNITELLQVSNPWFFGPESNIWDNGEEGNYWSDYTLRYPEVTRKDNPEIWLVDFFINPENIDHYPLVNPWIPEIIRPTPTPTSTPTPEPLDVEFPVFIVASIIIIVLGSIGMLTIGVRTKRRS